MQIYNECREIRDIQRAEPDSEVIAIAVVADELSPYAIACNGGFRPPYARPMSRS
jgi:hypothetical protein